MFAVSLINWYKKNHRELPWRNTTDPYRIWVSEIILQQTRVNQGLPYFTKFTQRFKNLKSLANANEEEVLKYWQGLGYYSRARNMHATAKFIYFDLEGSFPNNYTDLIKLKGIGDYTASAIASFSFNEKKAVVDGNVYRVLSRFFGVREDINSKKGKEIIKDIAHQSIPDYEHSIYNQAIMEFGAMVCKPKSPKCNSCDLSETCFAKKHNLTTTLPLKIRKQKVKTRFFNFIIFHRKNKVLLAKRTQKDIWKHLYQFPLFESKEEIDDPLTRFDLKGELKGKNLKKHVLSHQLIMGTFWWINVNSLPTNNNYIKVDVDDLDNFPVPKIIENYIKENLAFHLE
tara:strand:+ start:122 stop:1147 length:1026 start_codon:yes stop_codon:yes gene_type:complete